MTNNQPSTDIHEAVREFYAKRAQASESSCGSSDCCTTSNNRLYSTELLTEFPGDISNFSLGCGDPITLAGLQPGETVLDLGSGGGLDCFLAARRVGESGHVIGVDMTPEMLKRARASAIKMGIPNVEFREGYLEDLPVEDNSVDAVISNCVINLSPDKPQVFREIFRVLKPGGRVAISDIVTRGVLPEALQKSMEAWGACIAGALEVNEYINELKSAGFSNIAITPVYMDREMVDEAVDQLKNEIDPSEIPVSDDDLYKMVFSAKITANKPT